MRAARLARLLAGIAVTALGGLCLQGIKLMPICDWTE